MSKSYSEKLKDPRWQKKRLKILERDRWVCQKCGQDDITLHVHHRLYSKQYSEPWDYPDELLVALCEICHADESSERWEVAISELAKVLKQKFFIGGVIEITEGFKEFVPPHCTEACASAISFVLSNEDAASDMVNKYFEYLSSKYNDVLSDPF
jgi:uncharacterized protein CbrC (UPF0167 family)